IRPVLAETAGTVSAIDTRAIGIAVVELGGGRMRAADAIDHAVGFTQLAGLGSEMMPDSILGVVHASDDAAVARGAEALRRAYRIGDGAVAENPVVYERIGP